jgi:hypothetical protein
MSVVQLSLFWGLHWDRFVWCRVELRCMRGEDINVYSNEGEWKFVL